VVTVYGRESLHAVQLVDLTAGIERWSQVVSFAAWCCFAPDGRTVAIVRALPFQPPLGPVQLRDMPAGSLLADPTTESVVGWTADAHLLVVRDGGIRRLDGRTGEDRGGVPDLGWEDSGVALVSDTGRRLLLVRPDDGGGPLRSILGRIPGDPFGVNAMRLACEAWDLRTGRLVGAVRAAADAAWFAPDGGRVLVRRQGSESLTLWDLPPPRPTGAVLAVAVVEVGLATAWVAWRRRRPAGRHA